MQAKVSHLKYGKISNIIIRGTLRGPVLQKNEFDGRRVIGRLLAWAPEPCVFVKTSSPGKKCFGTRYRRWLYKVVNAVNSTELFTLK